MDYIEQQKASNWKILIPDREETERCKFCNKKMKYDTAPSTGWYCENCSCRKDDNGKEWLNHQLLK